MVFIGLDLCIWLIAAMLYSTVFWAFNAHRYPIHRAFFMSVNTGLITITVTFFVMEHVLQKRAGLTFFLMVAFLQSQKPCVYASAQDSLLCFFIPLIAILDGFRGAFYSPHDPAQVLEDLRSMIRGEALVFMGVGIWLTILVSSNLTRPFQEIIRALQGVRHGNFHERVRMTSNDEIGYTGDVINEMNKGLKERDRMRRSLDLAMEVQQNLLPKIDPKIEGLDVAGKSIYCEETGGDYYDYLYWGEGNIGKIGIVVGDVSDHGIPSALLMIKARAFLRQRSFMAGNMARIVSDVNRQLARDVEESGQFMTLVYTEIDSQKKIIRWVRAGHDPGLIYNPATDSFEELVGKVLPIGVSKDSEYKESHRKISPGQVITIGTDGIWEARNEKGEIFGKNVFKNIIRTRAKEAAEEILNAEIDEVENFNSLRGTEDDLTLVVIKVKQ